MFAPARILHLLSSKYMCKYISSLVSPANDIRLNFFLSTMDPQLMIEDFGIDNNLP